MSILRTLLARVARRSPKPAGTTNDLVRGDAGGARGIEPLPEWASTIHKLLRAGQFPEALRRADAWIVSAENPGDAHYLRHEILAGWGRHREARRALEAALLARCAMVEFSVAMGWSQLRAGHIIEGAAWFTRAIDRDPANLDALVGRAAVEQASGRSTAAIGALRELSAQFPERTALSILCARWELAGGELEAAERRLRSEVSTRPDGIEARRLLASILYSVDRIGESTRELEAACALEQSQAIEGAFEDLAVVLCGSGLYQEGSEVLRRFLPEHPSPRGHRQLAVALLALGCYDEAWHQMEYRWFEGPQADFRPTYPIPPWSGQDLGGRTILLHPEQGIGDTVQFIRYAPLLKALGARVLLRPLVGMERLSRLFDGVDDIVDSDDATTRADFYATLISLPGVFRTKPGTIPPPITIRDAGGSASLIAELPKAATGIVKIGVVWAGRPDHTRDRYRSIGLHALYPLFSIEGVEWFSLQKGVAAEEVDRGGIAFNIRALGPKLDDLVDVVAALRSLDLLISVDTGIAHLAATLGLPVWMLVAEPADARWLVGRTDTPWYPSMRLFRQRKSGDWRSVINDLADALRDVLGTINMGSDPDRGFVEKPRTVVSIGEEQSKVFTVPHLARVAHTPMGLLQYDPDDGARGPSIAHYGGYRDGDRSALDKLARSGDHCVEVGSACGWHAMGLARRVGETGEVWVCEPLRAARQMLRNNLAANAITNVTILERTLATGAMDSPSERGDAIDDLRLGRLDGLKVNEGADAATIIEGASDTLWRCRPWLMFAQDDDATLAKLASRVREFGYRTWRMETPLFNPDNFNRRTDDIFDGKTALTLIALPEESALPEPGTGCVELR